jgi:hypothetical protein
MSRRRLAAIGICVTVASCGRAEQPVLAEFFNASRLHDRTALQKLATTSFNPAVDGVVTSFEIVDVAAKRNLDVPAKEVSISAPVRLPTGDVVHKRLVVTLEQRDARWIVTAVTPAPAPAPSIPPS